VYPGTSSPSMSQSQGNQVPELQTDFNQLGNEFPDQPSQTKTDELERSSQSQATSHQQRGEGDIEVRLLPIAGGAYGAVHEATLKHNRSRLTVAVKTLYRNVHSCEKKFYKKLAKE
ncbi:1814_t:CDS:2, partial [Paraglomus occultum]